MCEPLRPLGNEIWALKVEKFEKTSILAPKISFLINIPIFATKTSGGISSQNLHLELPAKFQRIPMNSFRDRNFLFHFWLG